MQNKKRFKYKGLTVNLMGLPVSENYKKKKDQYIKREYLCSFKSALEKNRPKDLLVIYDIPHTMKKERDWFRRQLINLDFILVQKSVWVGPSPLPNHFVNYLKDIGLKNKFKTFKLNKSRKQN